MALERLANLLPSVITAISLLSCTAIPTTPPAGETPITQDAPRRDVLAEYAAIANAGERVFKLDPSNSTIRIYVFRSGRAARLGHNHVLSAPRFVGFFLLPTSGASNGRFDLEFRLDQLEFDNPAHRAVLGSAFSSALHPEAIEATRTHMLGSDNMQAERFPLVRVHSVRISGESPKFAADVQIEMHGQTREMWVPLNVEGLPDHLSVAGSLVLRQSEFGAKPYSALGGLLAVQDEVVIEFKLIGA